MDDLDNTTPTEKVIMSVDTDATDTVATHTGPILTYTYSSPIASKSNDILVSLPSATAEEVREAAAKVPNIDVTDSEEGREWSDALTKGIQLNSFNNLFNSTLKDSKSNFKQSVSYNGSELMAKKPTLPDYSNTKVSGERGVMRVMQFLGSGTIFQVPLWHSGFWITFKAPSEADIVELHRMMVSDKITFGRATHGLAFSNVTSYTTDRLVDFALSHIYETTVSSKDDLTIEQYKEIIACQDIPNLVWGIVATMYPKGFAYQRACINDPLKCNYVLKETLNIARLQWPDDSALTEWQKSHLSHRGSRSRDLESIKRYKDELMKTQSRTVKLGNGEQSLSIVLRTPSIAQHVASGYKWISNISDMVTSALGDTASADERNNYITRHGQATVMRQFAHWVERIEFNENVMDDIDSIELLFDTLSADDVYRDDFITEVSKYINESTLSVIGIPTFDCPSCSTPQVLDQPLPKHVNVLPLDANQLFFALAVQVVTRLRVR